MKTVNPNNIFKTLVALAIAILPVGLQAQNLTTNSNFSNSSTGWTSGCSIEVYSEPTYGGSNSANFVTEIDMERCLDQTICIFPGVTYNVSFRATRRISTQTPANVSMTVKVTGLTSGTAYINQDFTYNNTAWAFTTSNMSFSIPAGSTDRQVALHLQSLNNTATYGVIVDDITLRPAVDMSINGTGSATLTFNYPYSVINAPASGVNYNWNFGPGASPATSTLAVPTTAWNTNGAKNVVVAVSNGTCTVASLSKSVAVFGVLPVTFTSFTGVVNNNRNVLSFRTSDEENVKWFVVERSFDGQAYDSVGRVPAANTAGNHTYSFAEASVGGTVWYRIRQVDFSGGHSYSGTVVVKGTAVDSKLTVFPSRATTSVNYTVSSARSVPATVQVFDATGKLVINDKEQSNAGSNLHSLNISLLNAGVYFLKVQQGGESMVKQFQKL